MPCFLECIFCVSELNFIQAVDLYQLNAENAMKKKKSNKEKL